MEKETLPYWPYCTDCKTPYRFEPDEPFAHCLCPGKTVEWGEPRPADYVKEPE